jgi:hypothetical protein
VTSGGGGLVPMVACHNRVTVRGEGAALGGFIAGVVRGGRRGHNGSATSDAGDRRRRRGERTTEATI